MRVVIAGGSGLIGRRIASALQGRGDEPIVLSRRAAQQRLGSEGITVKGWDPRDASGSWTEDLRAADAVINLAGSSVGRWPWTARRMRDLVDSRLVATAALVDAMARMPSSDRPPVFISGSGVDIYEGNDAEPATEESAPADTFLARLCVDWESAALHAQNAGVRVVVTRMSLVVDREAPALQRFALPVRLFGGGRLGSGRQWISWIDSTDVVGLMLLALRHDDASGAINFASPEARQQVDFSRSIARVVHRPFWLPTPATPIRLALGKQATLVLGSRRVAPARALSLGYAFEQPVLEVALAAAFRTRS
ncbi:MAG TPA: TIGR01777 family oxidoreductase [Candidatus Limnocylindrales bacterium]